MKEHYKYLNIPEYYTDLLSNIHSTHLVPLFKNNPISYLRTLYTEDNKQFYDVRDELILRGIGFQPKYQNNYLLDRPYSIKNIIYKKHNTYAYKEIKFTYIGVSNFIERFQVKSDRFFCGIPLEGIQHFTRGASLEVLKDLFIKSGFSIIPIQEFIFLKRENIKAPHPNADKVTEKSVPFKFTQLPPKNTKIDYLFEGNDYLTFRRYCKEKNIENFNQLTIDFVKNFEYEKHIRKKTADKVYALYEKINSQNYNIHINIDEAINTLLDNSFKDLMDKTEADYIKFLNEFHSANEEVIYNNNFPFEKVKEIEEYMINFIFEQEEKRREKQINNNISKIKKHPSFIFLENLTLLEIKETTSAPLQLNEENEDLLLHECFDEGKKYEDALIVIKAQLNRINPLYISLEKIMSKVPSRDIEIMALRQRKTLEEIGNIFGVTRERVRQIESKTAKRLLKYENTLYLSLFINHYTIEKSRLLSVEQFMDFYEIEGDIYKAMLHLFFEKEKNITYVKGLKLYIEKYEYMYVKEILKEIGEVSIIDISEVKQYFSAEKEDIHMRVLDLILKSKGFKKVKQIYVQDKLTIIERINYLFEHIITEPLEINQEGYTYFKKIMEEIFEIPYKSTIRAVSARIADGENVVLVDGNTYAYHKKEAITNTFLEDLENLIDEMLEIKAYVDPRYIYKEYPELMSRAQIISATHLYSIIKIYFEEKYKTGNRSSLYIYKSGTGIINLESILLNFLNENEKGLNKDEVLVKLNWKEHKLEQLLARIKSVLLVEENKLKTVKSFNFEEKDLKKLKAEFKHFMKKGYGFVSDLQFELGLNVQMGDIIPKYNLSNGTTLLAILRWLFPDLHVRSQLLYWSNSPINNLEKVISLEYPKITSREKINQYIKEKGYSDQMLYLTISRLLEKEYFYPYTTTKYINAKQIHISEEIEESLSDYLSKQMKENDYKSVYLMSGFTNQILPISNYDWTEKLIYQFANKVGYKQIESNPNYRFDKLIIVKEEMNVDYFDELVLHIVNTEYEGRYHGKELAQYLESKQLVNNPSELPILVQESTYFRFDTFGFFEVRDNENVAT